MNKTPDDDGRIDTSCAGLAIGGAIGALLIIIILAVLLSGCGSTGTLSYDGKTVSVGWTLPKKEGLKK